MGVVAGCWFDWFDWCSDPPHPTRVSATIAIAAAPARSAAVLRLLPGDERHGAVVSAGERAAIRRLVYSF
jgi:hypothetical protein